MTNPWAKWLAGHDTVRYSLSRKAGWDTFVHTPSRPSFAVLTRAEMTALSGEELEDYTEARMVWNANLPTVKTHQLTSAFQVIDQVMASNWRDADRLRGSVVIDAAPGLGKTTIATRTPATSTAAPTAATAPKRSLGINGCRSRSSPSRPGSR